MKLKTGARGLRTIMEDIMLDIMFVTPDDKSISKVVVNEQTVSNKEPEIIKKEKALKKELFSSLERYFSCFAPKCDFFIKSKLFVGASFLRELVRFAEIKIVFC